MIEAKIAKHYAKERDGPSVDVEQLVRVYDPGEQVCVYNNGFDTDLTLATLIVCFCRSE